MVDQTKMSLKDAQRILQQAFSTLDASITAQDASNESDIMSFTLDLTTVKPRSEAVYISLPFTSVMIDQATDINTYVYLIPNTKDSSGSPIRMGIKDIFSKDLGFSGAYIYWDAQPKKQVIMNFFIKGKPSSGRLVIDNNSSNSQIMLNNIFLPNDGYSFLLTGSFTQSPVNGGCLSIQGFLPNEFYYGGTGLFGGSGGGVFKVPAGYRLRYYALVMKITTAFTYSSGSNAYGSLDSFDDLSGTNDTVLMGGVPDAYTVGSTSYYGTVFTGNNTENTVDEGKYVGFVRHGSGVLSAGQAQLVALVRLEKKVG